MALNMFSQNPRWQPNNMTCVACPILERGDHKAPLHTMHTTVAVMALVELLQGVPQQCLFEF